MEVRPKELANHVLLDLAREASIALMEVRPACWRRLAVRVACTRAKCWNLFVKITRISGVLCYSSYLFD